MRAAIKSVSAMPADQEDSVPHWSKFSKDDGHYGIVWHCGSSGPSTVTRVHRAEPSVGRIRGQRPRSRRYHVDHCCGSTKKTPRAVQATPPYETVSRIRIAPRSG